MELSKIVKKFKRNAADYGYLTAFNKGVLFPFRASYENRTYRIYVKNLTNYREPQCGESVFTYCLLDRRDHSLMRQIVEMEEWLDGQLAARLENGICLVALDKETVAGFNLVSFGTVFMPLVNVRRTFRSGQAWSEQITVSKDYRGKGLGADLRYRTFSELKLQGIRKFYGGTLSDNMPNLQLTRKVGFCEIADIHYHKILHRTTWSCTRVRP